DWRSGRPPCGTNSSPNRDVAERNSAHSVWRAPSVGPPSGAFPPRTATLSGQERDMTPPSEPIDRGLEGEVRAYFIDTMPPDRAHALLRLAFHDAGTYDVTTHTGGAHGAIRLPEQLARAENTGWSAARIERLAAAKGRYHQLSWADLIAVSGVG